MSLALLLPAGLLALLAVLLPVLLHLDRQTEARLTPFAALRWIAVRLAPRRRIRFREILLLVLRVLLVAALALLFAQPVSYGVGAGTPWVLVAPGVDVALARAQLTHIDAKAQWHWLAPGFADVVHPAPSTAQPLASLLREMDALLPAQTPVTVIVPRRVQGVDGERPRLSRAVDWRVQAPDAASASPTLQDRPAPAPATPTLVVRHGDDTSGMRYLRAAAQAWQLSTPKPGANANTNANGVTHTSLDASPSAMAITPAHDIAAAPVALPAQARWLAWLAPGDLPAAVEQWIRDGGVALLASRPTPLRGLEASPVWRSDDGAVLAVAGRFGRGRVIVLAQPLTPQAMPILLDETFPSQLRAVLDGRQVVPSTAYAEALKPLTGGPRALPTPVPLDTWLALLVAALFVLERLLATSARRQALP